MIDAWTRARLFSAQYQSFESDIPFWLALAKETGDPILEMGCGTGRLVKALASKGFHVLGVDHDPAMIAHAKSRLNPNFNERVSWTEQNLASFAWKGTICLAIGALNTFAYLNDSEFCSALICVKDVLKDQGLIGLDLPPDDAIPYTLGLDDVPLDSFEEPEHGTSVELRANVTAHNDEQVDVSWIYDELLPDGNVIRYLWEQTYFQRSENTLHKLIHASGFTIRSTFGDYDFSVYRGGSRRRLMVLEKQNEGA